ncbi:MAG: hypothetical protein HY298_05595 [Verrucomicrobia bacterium]|nr:hypothetical protein [Verrucomicrobiota bacterium]
MNVTRKLGWSPSFSLFGSTLKRELQRAWLLALLLVAGPLATAQQTNAPARLNYESFKLITDRNIFNPNRTSRSPGIVRRETRPEVRAESFALVGTMSYEKGLFAFFDGTSSEYRKVLKRADTIAGYKVEDITPNHVRLASGTNEIDLPVGMQMRREEEGGWLLSARTETPAAAPSQTNVARPALPTATAGAGQPAVATAAEPTIVVIDGQSETIVTNAEPQTASGGSEDDILTKLRQRREQELNR